MPAIQYWFTGAALGAFLAILGTISTLGYAWYRAALIEQQVAISTAVNTARTERLQTIRWQLLDFYTEGQNLKRESVTAENFPLWMQKTNQYANTASTWIQQNIVIAAKDRFLDMSGPSYTYNNKVNAEHDTALNWLTKSGDNLKVLTERLEAYMDPKRSE